VAAAEGGHQANGTGTGRDCPVERPQWSDGRNASGAQVPLATGLRPDHTLSVPAGQPDNPAARLRRSFATGDQDSAMAATDRDPIPQDFRDN